MSIHMFVVDPVDEREKMAGCPVFTEDIFRHAVLPVAEKIEAEMICLLGIGIRVTSADFPRFEAECRSLLDAMPATATKDGYIEARVLNLVQKLHAIFGRRGGASVFVG